MMWKRSPRIALSLFITCLLCSTKLKANDFELSLALFGRTQDIFRGAKLWSRPALLPGIQLTFGKRLSLQGPSLAYTALEPESPWELKFTLASQNDDEPFINFFGGEEGYRNQRDSALELQLLFKRAFGPRDKGYAQIELFKEWIEHHSLAGSFSAGYPVLPFTTFGATLGWGERAHNQYVYGPEAESGLGWWSADLKVVIPFVPWDGIWLNFLNYSSVVGDQNQMADYIRGDNQHWSYSFVLIWNIL